VDEELVASPAQELADPLSAHWSRFVSRPSQSLVAQQLVTSGWQLVTMQEPQAVVSP
jgi:hypothetical protein